MSFDKPTRNALATMVNDCRRSLTLDIRDQLQVMYGLQPDGSALSLETLRHLDERGLQIAVELRAWQQHIAATEPGTDGTKMAAAFERVAHETAFTSLNRLAALRMCEERGHVIECVRRGMESDGFVLFDRFSGGVLGTRGETYRFFLERMFDELAVDLGALFDLRAPQSLVFPRERCLEETLAFLNDTALADLWQEDETIGWMYQYFNSKEERHAMRTASAAPRNSRELAVRNQFFTPRYVVEFLTDNTLGRLWYETRKGKSRATERSQYLVRRPKEVFLEEGQGPLEEVESENDLSQGELLGKPSYIRFRSSRDPRDLKILDPACGSGHFLLYAFDLLETIYEEAWASEEQTLSELTGKSLRDDFPDWDTLKRSLPSLIIRHNLYGIDIDLRACQITTLALWLRAQRTFQRLELKGADRPKIKKSNVVCAEPMPGEGAMLDEFVNDLHPRVLGQLVRIIFDKMKLAGEAGPLLKIEGEISSAIAEAKRQWIVASKQEQMALWPEAKRPKIEQIPLFDLTGITDEEFWNEAEGRLLEALSEYARATSNGDSYSRGLFSEEASRGFAFIDLCRNKFDVILMNPPFGEFVISSKDTLFASYPTSKYDLGAAFASRAASLIRTDGLIGSLCNRSIFFGQMLADWRMALFVTNGTINVFSDLGVGVLDSALVEAVGYVFSVIPSKAPSVFLKATAGEKPLQVLVARCSRGDATEEAYLVRVESFCRIPDFPFAYWTPKPWLTAYSQLMPLSASGLVVKQGMESSDNFRFVRLWWEPPAGEPAWKPYSKGGWFGPHWRDMDVVVNWGDSGREVKAFSESIFGTWTKQITNTDYYGRPGICYPMSRVEFSPRVLPAGSVVGCKGPVVMYQDGGRAIGDNYMKLLGILSSSAFRGLLNLTTTSGDTMRKSYREKAVASTPIPSLDTIGDDIGISTKEIVNLLRRYEGTIEICRGFCALPPSGRRDELAQEIRRKREALDNLVSRHYGFQGPRYLALERTGYDDLQESTKVEEGERLSVLLGYVLGRWDIRFANGQRSLPQLSDPFAPLQMCAPGMLQDHQGMPAGARDVPVDYPLEISWLGVLVDDVNNPQDIERRVRQAMGVLWLDHADTVEQEMCEALDVNTLREHFRKPLGFFANHLKQYSKSRRQAPIYWPLSTESGSYTLWIYCHRLSDDLLYKAVNAFVKPKIEDTQQRIRQIESRMANATGKEASKSRDEFEEATVLLNELIEFRDELLRISQLPYRPNLNDGVLITASPLWKLFRLPKWRKDLEHCWNELQAGEYDWTNLAYSIWPDRVRDACKHDRSIAIARGLENLFEATPKEKEQRKGRKKIAEEFALESEE